MKHNCLFNKVVALLLCAVLLIGYLPSIALPTAAATQDFESEKDVVETTTQAPTEPEGPAALDLAYRYGANNLIQFNTNLPSDTPCDSFLAGDNGCNIDQSLNEYQQVGWIGMDNADGTIVLTFHFNSAFEAGQTYILKSGSVFGFTNSKTYTLDKDYVFTWDGSAWTMSNELPTEPTEPEGPAVLNLAYRYGANNLIQFNTNLPATTPLKDFTAEENGCNIDQSLNKYQQVGWIQMLDADGTIVLTFHFNSAFEAGQTYILKSGSVFGFTDGKTYTLDKDYVFTWDGSNWTVSNVLPTEPDPTEPTEPTPTEPAGPVEVLSLTNESVTISGYTFEYTAAAAGTLNVTVGDCNPGWRYKVFYPNGVETIYQTSFNPGVNGSFEGDAGTWKIVFYAFSAAEWDDVEGTVSFTVTFTPDEGGGEVEKDEYAISETKLTLGENNVSLLDTAVTTIFEFTPDETGVYTFTSPEGSILGYWGAGTFFLQNPNSTTNTYEWTCTGVGQSACIGVSGVEGAFTLKVEKTGEYEVVETPIVPYENKATLTPFALPEGAVLHDYIDVTVDTPYSAVLGEDGYYHLGSADGDIILVDMDYQDIILTDALLSDRPVMYVYATDEAGNKIRYDIGAAVQAYEAVMDENGYYPLTEDLILFYDDYAMSTGIYSFYVTSEYNEENVWMYCMRTVTFPESTEPTEPDPSEPVEESTATLSFADVANRTSLTTLQQVWEQNGITFTNDKADSTNDVANYSNPVRLYPKSTIKIEHAGMTKIEFASNAEKYTTNLQNSITEGNVTVEGNTVTVTFAEAQDSYTITLSAQVRLDSLTVTFGGSSENPTEPTPTEPTPTDPTPTEPETTEPEQESLSIAEAIALGQTKAHNDYTTNKYQVTGVITEVYNTTYGNMKITDGNGNTLTIYGTYSADGSTRYDALPEKPIAGDTVTVYGIIGQYNGNSQMKDGWIISYTEGEHEPTEPAPSEPEQESLSIVEANELGLSYAHNTFTAKKYKVTGKITEIKSETWGNMNIADEAGNTLYIYGLYNEDGSVRYDAMTDKPVVGDTITVYGIIGQFNGTAQMKNGWIVEHTPAPGSQNNPIYLSELENSLEVAAGATVYYYGRFNGSNMTITGTTGYEVIIGEGTSEDTDGTFTYDGVTADIRNPFIFAIHNTTADAVTYSVVFAYPQGSDMNPEVIGTDWDYTVSIAAGNEQGYYYHYTATHDGLLQIIVSSEGGWQYNIVNDTTYASEMGDSADGAKTHTCEMTVSAGDEISIVVNTFDPENPYAPPAGDVTVRVQYKPGTEPNPILLTELSNTVTVPAGETVYYHGNFSGMKMTITGEGSYIYGGTTFEIDGVAIPVASGSWWSKDVVFAIVNEGETEADYTVTFAYPAGTQDLPEVISTGLDYVAKLEAGNEQGYFFKYTAEKTGTLLVHVSIDETVPGYGFTVNNKTTGAYGDQQWSDMNPINPYSVNVTADDEIEIVVYTWDPENWSFPAGAVTVKVEYKPDEPVIEDIPPVVTEIPENIEIEIPEDSNIKQEDAQEAADSLISAIGQTAQPENTGIESESNQSVIESAKENIKDENNETVNADSYKTTVKITVENMVAGSENESTVITKVTYDVTPYLVALSSEGAVMGSTALNNFETEVTFRLPVDKGTTATHARVLHNGDFLAFYPILTDEQGNKYVEVKSTEFSQYTVEFVPVVLKFVAATLSLDSSLAINFKIDNHVYETYEDLYVIFDFMGRQTRVNCTGLDAGSTTRATFAFTGVAASWMAETVTATLYGTYNGEVVHSESVQYSVKQYCMNQLNKANVDAAKRKIYADLLLYGEAAQIFANYKTDDLASKDMTAEMRTWATPADHIPNMSDNSNAKYAEISDAARKITFKSNKLVLESAIVYRLYFTAKGDISNYTFKVTTGGKDWTITSENFIRDEENDRYYINFAGMFANEMRKSFYITAYQGNTVVSNTVMYDIQSYVARNYNSQLTSDPKQAAMIRAMLCYGDSVKAVYSPAA